MDPKLQAIHFLSILTLFFLCIAPSYHQQVCNHQDQSALLTFNSSISFSLFEPLNWSYTSSCCQWEGVSCDANGSVTVGDLTSLTHLNLSNNDLGGSLTEGIVRLTNLRVMDLSSNSISGPIPATISNLKNLELLDLSYNNFTGEIPASLESLTSLEIFNASYNNLQGPVPIVAPYIWVQIWKQNR